MAIPIRDSSQSKLWYSEYVWPQTDDDLIELVGDHEVAATLVKSTRFARP